MGKKKKYKKNPDQEFERLLNIARQYQEADKRLEREREYIMVFVRYAEYLIDRAGLPMKAMTDLLAYGDSDTMFHMVPFLQWKYRKETTPITGDDVDKALEEADRIVKGEE